MDLRKCLYCGKDIEIIKYGNAKKYCNEGCKLLAQYRNKYGDDATCFVGVCVCGCGEYWFSSRHPVEYIKGHDNPNWRKEKKKKKISIICEICGNKNNLNSFEQNNATFKICSTCREYIQELSSLNN